MRLCLTSLREFSSLAQGQGMTTTQCLLDPPVKNDIEHEVRILEDV